jgi:hypothetical protein
MEASQRMTIEFVEFPKIARLRRGCVITEKIDGTNAQIHITETGEMLVGSRTRWITPEADNYGFARWAQEHRDELSALGPGSHFGEWWGSGIQRRYGVEDKRLSLFNVGRWGPGGKDEATRPACCGVVPTLYSGDFSTDAVNDALTRLRLGGSAAAPGFMQPEGVVIYHAAARALFKVTLEKDEQPKGWVNG